MNDILKKINEFGIVPVVKIDDAGLSVSLAKALSDGGLPVAEITFRTDAAEQSIRSIAAEMPNVLVGAGTVLSVEQVGKAIDAGAKFIVSPGFNPEVVEYCIGKEILIIPGCSSPTDIEMAMSYGIDVVKFFPSEAFGGIKTLKAISAPYNSVRFIPTGGITVENINDYLSFDRVLACGGTWMVKDVLIKEKRFDEVAELTKEAIAKMIGFELAHIGINTNDDETARRIAEQFASLFGFALKAGNTSYFAGPGIEVNKPGARGKNGHIAVRTNSVARAISYLKRAGVEFDETTLRYTSDGSLEFVYLKDEIGGFAVHLIRKN